MTEPQFYVEDVGDQNPTIWYSDLDGQCHIVARLSRGIESPYEGLAFAVLARVLAPDEATVERICEAQHDAYETAAVEAGWETQQRSRKPWADVPEANKQTMRASVLAVLAALAEDPAVTR